MGAPENYDFEVAPELPGADRIAKYFFGGVRQLTHRLWDFEIEGRANVPTEGPAIIAPNHLSFCDSMFVPAALPRRVWAIGKGEYMNSWKTKHIFPALGMIPVDRTGGDAAQVALDTAAKVLDNGHLFMIYPEGTRSRSGNLHKGRTGAARLALRCGVPIIPVGHQGTVEVQPPDAVMPKPRRPVVVRFGTPMRLADFGDPDDPRTLRRYTDAVMFEIAQLSGQTYVDTYAGEETSSEEATDKVAPIPTRPAVSKPSADEQERIVPRQPSVVGSGPAMIPTPVAARHRLVEAHPGTDRSGGSATDTSTPPSMPSLRLPPGRRDRLPADKVGA